MSTQLTRRDILTGLGLTGLGVFAVQGALRGQQALARGIAAPVSKTFEFSRGSGGMLAGFSDYSLIVGGLNCVAEVRPLPSGLTPSTGSRNAYYLAGTNRSDDLFMFLKAVLTHDEDGIVPNQSYMLSFDIRFASRSATCVGAGGDPSSVWLKAGGTPLEPVTTLANDGDTTRYLTMDVDKGYQMEGGKDLGLVGSIWNGLECPEGSAKSDWVMLHRTYVHPYPITADPADGGQLWIILGTDSGFEETTEVYYYRIRVELQPV
jgi:hypothetical protein